MTKGAHIPEAACISVRVRLRGRKSNPPGYPEAPATLGEHLRRAVGTGIAAIGTQLDVATSLVERRVVAQAEPDEPFTRAAIPIERQPQRLAVGFELELDLVAVVQLHTQPGGAATVQADLQFD